MTSVRLHQLTRTFGSTVALDNISLQINAGELFFLLGPSGCGKSTLLRIIAGLLPPSAGRVFFNQRDVSDQPTQQRNAVMCFQSYALWPHMTVRQNIRFGLEVRKLPTQQQHEQVEQALALVRLTELADRKPTQLSGGQQQRVALARALAVRPACLLLDEPLSNLDARLRHEMRGEIRRICKQAGATAIYVTHDQTEALSIADRVALMKDGQLVQVGTPAELYNRPASVFAADFIGHTNLLPGTVTGHEQALLRVETAAGPVMAAGQPLQGPVTLGIRPEQIRIVNGGTGASKANRLQGRLLESSFLGQTSEHLIEVGTQRLRMVSAPALVEAPTHISIEFDPADVLVLTQ
jgi:iron(III) transport system ATP-binding protein